MKKDIRLEKIRFGDFVEILNGSTPSTKVKENFGGIIPWITPKDLSDQQKKYIETGTRNITEKGLKSIGNRLLPEGTILLTSRAPIGLISIAQNEISTNQGFKNIVCNEDKIDNEYLYYLLGTLIEELQNSGTGTTFKEISKRTLENFEFFIINNLGTQKKIAKVLSDLDAKIELNNKINQELEAMAKTLYDYWFVQFDFPAYLSGTLSGVEGYKSSGGKMVYNEELKREIPEGWTDSTISDWIEHDKSGDWGKAQMEGNYTEKVSCIRGADLNGLNGKGEVKAPERYILEKNNHKILELGDIIVEISGGSPVQSTGRMGFITKETLERFEDPLICSNFCKAVTLKENYMLYNFVYEWNRIYDAGVLFGWEGKTSGIKNFLFEAFVTNYKLVKPSKELMKLFTKQVKPIHSKIQKNLQENQKLAELRDWLLPMLMNGQVKVENGYVAKDEVLGMVAEENRNSY